MDGTDAAVAGCWRTADSLAIDSPSCRDYRWQAGASAVTNVTDASEVAPPDDAPTFVLSIQIVSAPKVGGDLAEFQFPSAVDSCPSVGHVAIAGMFSGDDQVVGDDGGVVGQLDDVEIIGARVLGDSRLRFH